MAKARKAKSKGRPTSYSRTVASSICKRLSEGESLRAICRDVSSPAQSSVYKWLNEHSEFSEQYARAREAQVEHFAEEILEIADDGQNDAYVDDDGREIVNHDVIARSRLRVDTRKWLMSKLAPKKYGDKLELGSDPNKPLNIIHRVERVIVRPQIADGGGVRTAPGAKPV